MRIVGGIYKGRIFHPGKSFRSRPTTDFSKEGLFNVLENRISWEETDALDLFSGTGSISFELVSRGCRSVTAVEKDFFHSRFIWDESSKLGIENLRLIREDVFRFIRKNRNQYNLVFADPPFDMKDFHLVPELILGSGVLRENGLFILEHSKSEKFDHVPGFTELRKYGSVHFSFFTEIHSEIKLT